MDDRGCQSPTEAAERDAAPADDQLLGRFVATRDEQAFRQLVSRHAALVLGVCRRVLVNHHDAEEAFQATFLVLAQKAPQVRIDRTLAPWLYGVAYRIAVRAAQKRVRRREEPRAGEIMVGRSVLEEVTEHYDRQVLDEELNGLPERLREPLVLHYLVGMTNKQVADELRLTVRTVEGRQRRGKRLLRRRLALRKVSLPAAVAALAASNQTVQATTLTPLVELTAAASLELADGAWTPHSSSQETFSNHALELGQTEAMAMTSTFTPGAVVVGAAVLIASAIGLTGQQNAAPGADGQLAALLLQSAMAAEAESNEAEGAAVAVQDDPFGDSRPSNGSDDPFGAPRPSDASSAAPGENPFGDSKASATAENPPLPIDLAIGIERDAPAELAAEWVELLRDIGVSNLRLRIDRSSDQPSVEAYDSAGERRFRVIATLDSRNQLLLPNNVVIAQGDRAKLREYIENLTGGDLAPRARRAATVRNESATSEPEEAESDASANGSGVVDLSDASPNETEIRAALRSPLSRPINYIGMPLTDAVRELTADCDFPVFFDLPAMDAAVISPDTEVNLTVEGISLGAALRHLLRQVEELTYVVHDEVLMITTTTEAETMLELRVYDLADLDFPAKDIAERLVDLVEFDTWTVNGTGDGQIAAFGSNGLAVTQTPPVHDEIVKFLDQLERLRSNPGGRQRSTQAIEPRSQSSRGRGRF